MDQIEQISEDASYRGIKLLRSDKLETIFNRDRSSSLETDGMDADIIGLGLTNDNFISKTEMTKILDELKDAREIMRKYGFTLQSDLNIIKSRREFTEETINTFESGGNDLIIADMNEKGSEILSLQVRQQLQMEVMSLSSNSNILDLFS